MNDEKLISQKKISSFFFEKKLYQYATKSLNEKDRDLMKSFCESEAKAKKTLASVLMSFEYLEKLKETEINKEWTEQTVYNEVKKENLTKYLVISFLVLLLIVVSYLAYKLI